MKFFPVIRNALLAPAAAACVVRHGCAIAGRSAALLLLLIASAAQPAIAQSQTAVVIDCLPPDTVGNDRFLSYLPHAIKHPSLSLNGFDCTESSETNCNIGYGLKQVLEEVYSPSADSTMKAIFQKIIKKSNESLSPSTSLGNISSNTVRLQSRGFVALVAYVLDNNDYDPTTLNPTLPSASAAVDSFRTALLNTTSWMINTDHHDDGVHWATPVTSVARAMDFYLALENAYKHYDPAEYANGNSTNLLSSSEKFNLKNEYTILINKLEELHNIKKLGIAVWNRYDGEPGNAALAMQLAIGYATLAWQQEPIPFGSSWSDTRSDMSRFLRRAFEAAGIEAGTNFRHKYWHYQTDNGKHFWAEGPYYLHITLSKVIPFWHAARINSLLLRIDDRHPLSQRPVIHSYEFNDPFREDWLLRPLHWLADISTPDGKTPPLDDGHKHIMYNIGPLRWSSAYGEGSVGNKFAWIGKKINSSAFRKDLYPVEIAIPNASIPSSNPLDEVVGNTFANRQSGDGGSNNVPASDYARQEVVIRREIGGRTHYILLNGESGDAIERGEGHEQGDQMQLLYYVDNLSYLVDSGYDKPYPGFPDAWDRSTWNNYTDHNVMTLSPDAPQWTNNNGGVRSPFYNRLSGHRIHSEHQDINEIYRQTHENIDLLSAQIGLKAKATITNLGASGYHVFGKYYRNVLFIRDEEYPYIVDINAISRVDNRTNWYKMYYHGNSNTVLDVTYSGDAVARQWTNLYISENSLSPSHNTSHRLYIQPFTVERMRYDVIQSDQIRESYISGSAKGVGIPIKKMVLRGNDSLPNGDSKKYFTTVALIRPHANAGDPNKRARENNDLPSEGNRAWQYYTWLRDSSTVDVVAARSAEYYVDPANSASGGILHFPITEADSFYVELPANLNYGFVRLTQQNEVWSVDPSFQLNLEKSQLRISASGPTCIDSGTSTGHFVASSSGGKPPYSYSWSSYRICDRARAPECNAWNNVGATRTIDYGGYNGENFKIRVQVMDSSSPRQSVVSSEWEVRVLSSTEGSCPTDPNGKKNSDTKEMLSSDADLLEADQDIPETYALRQNFPNPFNPSTEILFDLPEDAMVSLIVYDVLGREVTRLLQEELRAGTHRARFDAGNLPSGVYFYRIRAGDFHSTHRMTLLK